MRFAASLAALVACALAAAAYADPVMNAANAQLAAAQAGILAFYPPDAKAKGVEGEATLDCRRTPHGALTACTLAAETPSGAGFGDAALAIAQRSRDDPTVAAPPDVSEDPPGYDFGAEALYAISRYFHARPATPDGQPTAGRTIVIPFRFQPPR